MDVPHGEIHKALKGFIRNMGLPNQGSMATKYSIEKALGFCTKYI
jgi:hypothetical protein